MNITNYAKDYNNTLSVIENCIQLLKQTNNEKTLEHITKVSKTGVEIANNYGLNSEKIELACYLHDISAIIPKDDYIEICGTYGIEVLEVERKLPMLLHQKVSRLIAEKIFNITDNEILSSIESHTTLRDKPSDVDMVVFIADKLSWDQDGTPPFFDCVSEAIKISLEKSCLNYIKYCLDNDMILIPHPMLIKAKNYLENYIEQNMI